MEVLTHADLAGPGIGDYGELETVLPHSYHSLLTPRDTQLALFAAKKYIEEKLCRELNLIMVTVPLIVDVESGVNDMLDRDGSRTPVQFHISNDHEKHPVDAQIVQAATKWKRLALRSFGMQPGEGLCTDMRAVRKDYFLDHDHSAYVDQWDWELAIRRKERNLKFLTAVVERSGTCCEARRPLSRRCSPSFEPASTRTFRKNSRSCTQRTFWRCIPTCRASSAKQRSCRNTRRSSSTGSAGR